MQMPEITTPSGSRARQMALQSGPKEARVNVLGVGISAVSMHDAVERSLALLSSQSQGYVCVTGVHGVIVAQEDEEFRNILNNSYLTTPDGMPTLWLGHLQGYKQMTRVYGPDYMLSLCSNGIPAGLRHFLYGGKPGVAEALRASLLERFPNLQIVGTFTPPFRKLTVQEEDSLTAQLEASRVDVLWVGLSTPKQERFMADYYGRLPVKLMVGVGAAFDLLSGNLTEAPDWMKRTGFQWLYRLIKEPRRLWRRYLKNNPLFIILTILQLTRLKEYTCTRSYAASE